MWKSPLTLFAPAVLLALAACVPLLRADCGVQQHCAGGYCPPAYVPPTYTPPVYVSPFEVVDTFIFVGVSTAPPPVVTVPATAGVAASPTAQPAGSQSPPPTGYDSGVPLPVIRGYFGQPAGAANAGAGAPARGVDVQAVASALSVCKACHTAPGGKDGVNLFAASGAFEPRVSAKAILESVQNDSMPKRGAKLSPSAKELLAAWAAQAR